MASKQKNFAAPPAIVVATKPTHDDESRAIVYVGENPYNGKDVQLDEWLGRGIDEWVWASAGQLRAFIISGLQTPASIVAYGRQGLPTFFEFLTSTQSAATPATLSQRHIDQFVEWLKGRTGWSDVTRRNRYTFVKSVLVGMRHRGVITRDASVFRRNPFPQSKTGEQGERALSPGERSRLAEALRKDIISLHQGHFTGSERDGLTVYVLALGLRTGMNTTPMLELRRDALGPHPFMPNMRLLRSVKRRGNSTAKKALNATRVDEAPMSVPMDGVALFEKVLAQTQPLLAEASPQHRDRVWLFRIDRNAPHHAGQVRALHGASLAVGIANLVARHSLHDDEGRRLRLNLSRLRKTMENRLWRLSNGDLFTVSLIMGHDPRVAEQSYLQVTPDMRQNATIVGEALPDMYRSGATSQKRRKAIPIGLEKTPVGACKDSLFGDMAPKDGSNHCADFISCFGCRSYALVGSVEDLHRLFSFYWFLAAERTRIASREWADHFAWIMAQIDAFTLSNFDKRLVEDAKQQARSRPHKFWKNYQMQAHGGLMANGH
ncbi:MULTISPECIES: hypothetical protein [unclassified Variovorax]|uniref:hypothetical protein n=1 Tax=unclassified Variovorax TaxID=663243 RepID=UPI003ECF782D